MNESTGWYFEQFEIGQVFETESITVTREQILAFAELTGDRNRLHIDSDFMRSSQFGDIIAHGLLVESLGIGLVAGLGIFQGTTIALAQADASFRGATLPGDQIHVRLEVTGKRESKKSDRGVLNRQMRVLNQRNELLVECDLTSLMRRRKTASVGGGDAHVEASSPPSTGTTTPLT